MGSLYPGGGFFAQYSIGMGTEPAMLTDFFIVESDARFVDVDADERFMVVEAETVHFPTER